MTQREVAVVGLGVMGSAAAWQLAARGVDVVGFEQFDRDHELGGSHGRSRIFRVAYEQDDYVRLAAESLGLWRDIEAQAQVQILVQDGAIDFGTTSVLDRIGAAVARHSLPAALLAAEEARRRWPGFVFEGPVLYSPDGGRTDADTARLALQQLATARGAELHFTTTVHAIRRTDSGVVIESDGQTVEANVVVVTTNAWLPRTVQGLVEMPPLTVTQEQPAFFTPHDGLDGWPSFIHYSGDGQLASDFAAYGLPSPLEGGMKVGEHGTGVPIDPDGRRPPPDAQRLERLSEYVRRHLPGLDPEPFNVSRCLYDMTATEDFIVDRVGPVVVGGGFSGHGFKFAPAVGRLLADLAQGLRHDIARLRLDGRT